ncbi:MAG TPA: hypothetical protein PKA70_20505 [Saprospiraceae bacterium]|nr:hypothetical protein [Saprospiraceae bacterium]
MTTKNVLQVIPEERQIYISGRVWHEVFPKVNLTPFIYILHQNVDLRQYGGGLRKYYFTFIVVKSGDKFNKPYARFNKKRKEADIAIGISYDLISQSSKEEALKLMEEAYLEGIDKLKELPLTDFDTYKFKNDIATLFKQDNWYKKAPMEM